jgi:effector-binding domain-containing protein
MEILTNQTYEMKNVISYREKMIVEKVNSVLKQLSDYITEKGLQKSGCVTTTTFSIENQDGQQLMDMEILCPVDKETDVPTGFAFKKEFKLTNALKIQHKGNPVGMQDSANALLAYMQENKYTPISSVYNVTVQEPVAPQDADNMIVDMYISVTENIL